MTISKRPRGRPRGSGKNDTMILAQVADLLVANPSMKPTTAMKRVISSRTDWPETDETLLRRLQDKWKRDGDTMLVAARERARPKSPSALEVMALIGTAYLQAHQIARSPEVLRALEAVSSWDRRLKQVMASPEISRWLKQMTSLNKTLRASPFFCGLDELARSPAIHDYLRLASSAAATRRP